MNNHLSPQTFKHKIDNGAGNPVPGMGQAHKSGRVKLLMRSLIFLYLNLYR